MQCWDVGLPGGVEGGGVALAVDGTLGVDRLLSPQDLCAGRGGSQTPYVPRLRGNGARGDPAPGGVRVAVRPRLAPDAVAVRGRPAPADGGQGLEAWCRWSACGVVTEGVDGGGEGLPTGLAGG